MAVKSVDLGNCLTSDGQVQIGWYSMAWRAAIYAWPGGAEGLDHVKAVCCVLKRHGNEEGRSLVVSASTLLLFTTA